MHRRHFAILLSIISFAVPVCSQPYNISSLDTYIANARTDWDVPGMAVAIVKGDSLLLSKGYGVRELGKAGEVNDRTLFAVASLSKAFTAASLAMLVDQGKLSWDDKVIDHLPYFQLYDPYATREMTVRDLLCHRSGLHTFGGDLIWYGTDYGREEVIRRLRYLKPRYSFRAAYGYQNILFLAAGEIVREVSGSLWDDFVKDSLFNPLGMERTNTSVEALAGEDNVAIPHTPHKGSLVTVPYRALDNIGPAASINSNVHDLSAWIRMWLRDDPVSGAGRLSSRVKHAVWTPHTVIPLSVAAMQTIPGRHFHAAALGWFAMDYRGRVVLTHSGGMDGMISRLVLLPEEKLGFVILTNSINSLGSWLMYGIMDEFLGGRTRDWSAEGLTRNLEADARERQREESIEEARVKGTKPSLPLQDYAGTYRSEMYGDVKVGVDGTTLVARFVPTATYIADLTHWHFDTFRIEMRDPTLPKGMATFVLDARGKVSEIRIDIPNPDFDFTELELKRIGG